MRDALEKADEVPVTLVVLIAYVTMAYLTGFQHPTDEKLAAYGWVQPHFVASGEWWRLFTSSFLHGGLVHLGMNSWALIQLGPVIERTLGSCKFAALYLLAQLGSNLAVCLVNDPFQPVVGGSGAIFGILGAITAVQMRQGRNVLSFLEYEGPRRMLWMIAIYLIIGAFLPFISNTGHVGGLIGGFLAAFVFLVPPRQPSRMLQIWRASIFGLFLGLTFYSLMPVTRWDWNLMQEKLAVEPERQQQFMLAKLKAYYGRNQLTVEDLRRFEIAMRLRSKGK